jgi:hypothetical protein
MSKRRGVFNREYTRILTANGREEGEINREQTRMDAKVYKNKPQMNADLP